MIIGLFLDVKNGEVHRLGARLGRFETTSSPSMTGSKVGLILSRMIRSVEFCVPRTDFVMAGFRSSRMAGMNAGSASESGEPTNGAGSWRAVGTGIGVDRKRLSAVAEDRRLAGVDAAEDSAFPIVS